MSVTPEALGHAKRAVERLDAFAREARSAGWWQTAAEPDPGLMGRFRWRMDDDFDTPSAVAAIFGAVSTARAQPAKAPALAAAVRECCQVALGLPLNAGLDDLGKGLTQLAAERDAARRRQDWAAADSIRDKLFAMGYVVEDTPGGTVVRRRG